MAGIETGVSRWWFACISFAFRTGFPLTHTGCNPLSTAQFRAAMPGSFFDVSRD